MLVVSWDSALGASLLGKFLDKVEKTGRRAAYPRAIPPLPSIQQLGINERSKPLMKRNPELPGYRITSAMFSPPQEVPQSNYFS